jgi:hypothetical protein
LMDLRHVSNESAVRSVPRQQIDILCELKLT